MKRLALFMLAASRLSALEISEILTENEGGLQDADLDSPGWIELHNEDTSAVDLSGWKLTDDPLNLAKWTLPAQTLAANGYLIVFASGKDRTTAGQELHSNFKLDPDGEYLALVRPDGVTKVTEFNPYPKLRRNVSWAMVSSPLQVTRPAWAASSSVMWRVPADDALGSSWLAVGFDDSGWTSGLTGFGYDLTPPVAAIDIKSATSVASLPSPPGWTAFTFAAVPESNSTATTATATAGGIMVKLDAVGAGLLLAARNRNGGASDILANSASLNNMAEDFIFSSTSSYLAGTPRGMDVTVTGLSASTAYPVTIYAYDRASSGTRSAIWQDATGGASATLVFNGSDGQLATDAAFSARSITINAISNASGQIILQGRAAPGGSTTSHNVFLNAVQIGAPSYASYITTNLVAQMPGSPGGLYCRAAFALANPASYHSLRLRVRYDDGFFAWLNGQLIVSRNAPGTASWDAAATADQPKAQGMTEEEIIVAIPPGLLFAGKNVLAMQGLRQGSGDTDFLLMPTVDLLGTLAAGPVYYSTVTPGAANALPYLGLVRDTVFSVDRQFFADSVTTALSCPTPGAQIRYTLDGSVPTEISGTVYSGPLTFSASAVLRAAAFYPESIPSNTDTHSYLHIPTLAAQPAAPAGWPATWGTDSEVDANDGTGNGTVPGNYAMDQRVVANAQPGYSVAESLVAIPTLSIALNPSDFLGANGIYQNPRSIGAGWERDCSVELIDPSGHEPGFHETCRIEIHGNSSRRPWRMQKHALRLSFKGEAGSARLHYRFFEDSNLKEFNKLVLRATFTDGWGLVSWDSPRYRPDDSVMMRDVWMRRSWHDLGNLSPQSRFVHVVINGLYWGVYDAAEHIDSDYAAAHLGGLSTDWEVVSDFVDPDASATSAWKSMFNAAAAGLSTPGAYTAIQQWLDPVNFADYYLLHQFGECEDWPHHNGSAYRSKTGPGTQYKWLPWDQEIALDNHSIDRISAGATNTATARTPGPLWNALRANPEWRLLVADRAHFLFNNDGPLSVTRCQDRWMSVAAELDLPIVAESARWGDTAIETPYGNLESRPGIPLKDPYTREADWLPNVNLVRDTWIPNLHNQSNSFSIISRLRGQSPALWPTTEPPAFAQHGGSVPIGYDLAISTTTAGAAIYFTQDGTDPRTPVTGAAAGALYTGPVRLAATGRVKARAVTGLPGSGAEVWSALTDAQFIVGTAASAANLVISEVCYNPPSAEGWEFIELMNISSGPIDLTGVAFTGGIEFTFPAGSLLGAGGRLVLVGDAVAFAAKFPSVTAAGVYLNKLDNSGEELALVAANGTDVRRFTFNDHAPWPRSADGGGFSLTLIAPETNPDHAIPLNWRSSVAPNGTPGTGDAWPFGGDPSADSDGDGLSNLYEYAMGDPAIGSAELVGSGLVAFRMGAGADLARVIVEESLDLDHWTALPATSLVDVSAPESGITVQTWQATSGSVRKFVRARVELR